MRRFRAAILAAGAALAAAPAEASRVTWQELIRATPPAEGLSATPKEFADIVPPRAIPAEGLRFFTEVVRSLYETLDEPPESHYFFCTIYYTPLQTGLTAERGFNMKPAVMKGSGGRMFPSDFVRAVVMEGFGRMAEPVGGKDYLAYNGRIHTRILGNRNNELVPRESVAANTKNPLVPSGRMVWVLDPEIYNQFGAALYRVDDTGGGLYRNQIDLYWGEDDPRGPGSGLARAASCDLSVKWIVPVLPVP